MVASVLAGYDFDGSILKLKDIGEATLIKAKAMALITLALAMGIALSIPIPIAAQEANEANSAEALAKKLANPVAALISVPLQLNYDTDIGPLDEGERWTLNIQPVVPFSISEDWNLISRTILPVISQDQIAPGAGSQDGIGDIVQSFFFSPKMPTDRGWIWGVGPVLLVPTGSDDLLTTDKWGAGPTAVALKQKGPFTFGALVNHIWSYAGDDGRTDVNATFLQPFFNYTTKSAISFILNTETTYDWDSEEWSVPIHLMVTKVSKLGGQMFSWGGGVRYWADSPDNGPEGLGARVIFTLLFPR